AAARADRGSLLDQDEEGGLEGVLRVGLVAEDAPAHPQHHRAVPPEKLLERRAVPPGDERLQKRAVGQAALRTCPMNPLSVLVAIVPAPCLGPPSSFPGRPCFIQRSGFAGPGTLAAAGAMHSPSSAPRPGR